MGTAKGRRNIEKLSALFVARRKVPGYYGDGRGLWLRITATGSKNWILRYMIDGRAREMGLGSAELVSLEQARVLAKEHRAKARIEGVDPIEARRQQRAEGKSTARDAASKLRTFAEAAQECHTAMAPGWKNIKHGQQWINTLTQYAFPAIGTMPVSTIATEHVLRVLTPIWTTKTETATRLQQRIKVVFDYAKALGYYQGENPADWKTLSKTLAKPSKVTKVVHHKALPYGDLYAFLMRLRDLDATIQTRRAFEFLILTATRTSEVLNADWNEIDLDAATWLIPEERMKAGKAHRVPLSPRSIEILHEMRTFGSSGYVFAGAKPGRPLSNMAFLMLLRRMDLDITAHGFRSTFRDWAAENTNFPVEVMEAALAHAEGNETVAAYARSDLFVKRGKLMDQWAKFATTKPATGNVVDMQKQGKKKNTAA